MRRVQLCPFCREPLPNTDEEGDKRMMKRVEANDSAAMLQEGGRQLEKGDHRRAFELFSKAAELGDAEAHYRLAELYIKGHGVEMDKEKEIFHLEEAAIAGHPDARYILGVNEWDYNSNVRRAVAHWFIAARQGEDDSIKALMKVFKEGYFSKEGLAAALRAQKAAVDATKSPQRAAAEEYYRRNNLC